MSEANRITSDLLDEIPKRFPKIRVWRANVVKAMVIGAGGKPRMIQAGLEGQGDISGILGILAEGLTGERRIGIRIEVEVKAGKDRLRPEQIAFRNMILAHGGIYVEARSVADGLEKLDKAIAMLPRPGMQSAAEIVKAAGGPEKFLEKAQRQEFQREPWPGIDEPTEGEVIE